MRTFILCLALLSSTVLPAQEGTTVSIANGARRDAAADASWFLKIGTRTVLRSNAEDPARNVITVRRSSLKKRGNVVLLYTPGEAQPGWERTITVVTSGDQQLQEHKGNRLRLTNSAFSKLAKPHKELHIYTMALPTDPGLRATVRVRRVHLATIKFL